MRKTIGFIIRVAMATSAVVPRPASTLTVGLVRDFGVIRIGHRHDPRPFSYVAADGVPAGYRIGFCNRMAIGVCSGTTAETWLKGYVARFGSASEVVTVDDHGDGTAGVASGTFGDHFADRALLLGQLETVDNPVKSAVSEPLSTFEPYAIALLSGAPDELQKFGPHDRNSTGLSRKLIQS